MVSAKDPASASVRVYWVDLPTHHTPLEYSCLLNECYKVVVDAVLLV